MFQIFDCNGRPVGRPQGYARHATAQALVNRQRSRIATAIWSAYHAAPVGPNGRKLVYRILWVGKDYDENGVNLKNSFNTPSGVYL